MRMKTTMTMRIGVLGDIAFVTPFCFFVIRLGVVVEQLVMVTSVYLVVSKAEVAVVEAVVVVVVVVAVVVVV